MPDPKPSPRQTPIADSARDVAGDTRAADPQAVDAGAEAEAAQGNAISPESARDIAPADAADASEGELERGDRVDAHDVAGDTLGASR